MIKNKKSGLIFTYGLTNAGKTYTVIGDPINPGILPHSLKYITQMVDEEYKNRFSERPHILCNFIEIYNEEVFDLLANEGKGPKCKKKVQVKEKDKIFYVQCK